MVTNATAGVNKAMRCRKDMALALSAALLLNKRGPITTTKVLAWRRKTSKNENQQQDGAEGQHYEHAHQQLAEKCPI